MLLCAANHSEVVALFTHSQGSGDPILLADKRAIQFEHSLSAFDVDTKHNLDLRRDV